ncbi:MAG: phenylalanine--tRNA ligase subunit alpha [Candidatus Moraniibacteriota bacterium]
MLKNQIAEIVERGKQAFVGAKTEVDLTTAETLFLGRKSEFNALMKGLKDLSPEEKREAGPLANAAKQLLMALATETRARIERESFDADGEWVDVTAPGVASPCGHLHPITRIEHEIEDILTGMGFAIADGPEIETEHYNFDVLNMPVDHPARDMQDTFWLASPKSDEGGLASPNATGERYLPRTQTSPVQVRYMETHAPPFRIIVPGRVFRNEATDASHEHTFHQFECLMVGDDVSVANFKWVAETFFSRFFGKAILIRLRPSFFPFTEPSFEFDISCTLCDGSGCSVCKQSGWLEIGGSGMVNQKVFESAGYPRGRYQGFAWGFGITRLAMMKYKVSDIRLFMSGDLRFIRQF